ncbi:MAG TPA: hypothetical protein VM782_12770 [Stellaceae bacterium]|nr:hypothetical protein [Stellaceae bacterium]
MTEPVLGLAGAVLLALSIAALFLRPRRSRGRVVDIGLAAGAGLLGLAIGLVVAERVRPPAVVAAAAPEQPPPAAQPATAAPGYVESRISLQFPIDDEYPIGSDGVNVADWYAFRNSISYSPGANEKLAKPQEQTLKLLADVSWSWLIVIAFEQPTRYGKINVSFTGGELPYYQIARQDPHYAVIHVQGRIPPGQMEITTSE